jgi:hypothetical protein
MAVLYTSHSVAGRTDRWNNIDFSEKDLPLIVQYK